MPDGGYFVVLTLLLLEFGFGDRSYITLACKKTTVLTLLLLEFGFGALDKSRSFFIHMS